MIQTQSSQIGGPMRVTPAEVQRKGTRDPRAHRDSDSNISDDDQTVFDTGYDTIDGIHPLQQLNWNNTRASQSNTGIEDIIKMTHI